MEHRRSIEDEAAMTQPNVATDRFVEGLITEAEIRSETVLAFFRLAGLLLFGVLLGVFDFVGHDHVFRFSFAVYAFAVVAGLACAWRRVYHGAIPWLITTAEVAVVLHFQAMLVLHQGFPIDGALAVPASLLLYLTLAQGAARYRPYLILYAAGLALLGVAALHVASVSIGMVDKLGFSVEELARVALTATMAATFFLIARRTRGLLWRSLREARWRDSLARFVPTGLVSQLTASGSIDRQAKARRAAVMFVDVRGFTGLSEKLPPVAIMALLDEFRRHLVPVIERHGGAIDKFIGDAIMAVFSADDGVAERSAQDAVRCIWALRNELDAWNRERRKLGEQVIEVGIGLHWGDVVAGVLGDEERLEFTVIGDTVNVAQRLEELSSQLGLPILISGETLAAGVASADREAWTEVPPHPIRGLSREVSLYAPKLPTRTEQDPGTLPAEPAPGG